MKTSYEIQELRLKTINRCFFILHLIIFVLLGIYQLFQKDFYLSAVAFSATVLLLIPNFISAVFHIKRMAALDSLIYGFCFLSFSVGMALQAYHTLPYYDKLVHTVSGSFFSFFGFLVFHFLKKERKIEKSDYKIVQVFCFSFSMMVAGLWEIYEYTLDYLIHTDPQNVLTTGVHDTMQDMIVCMIGAFLFGLFLYRYYIREKNSIFICSFEAFFQH